jgi:protein-tyrosine phosphatase
MQVTAGSLTGRFGSRPKYWGERLLAEGRVHVLATDAHGAARRPPLLAEGRAAAERFVGTDESWHLVRTRPAGILDNQVPSELPPLPEQGVSCCVLRSTGKKGGFLGRLFAGRKHR